MVPSASTFSSDKLHLSESLVTCAMALKLPSLVLLYNLLNRPKHQSGEGYLGVSSCHHSPCQVLQHGVVLALPRTIGGMKEHLLLAQTMVVEIKMQLTYDSV